MFTLISRDIRKEAVTILLLSVAYGLGGSILEVSAKLLGFVYSFGREIF